MTPLVSQLWPQFMADPAFASCFGQVIVEHARMLRQSQQVIFTLRSAAPLDKGLCARLLASLQPDYEGFELKIENHFGYAMLDETALRDLLEEMKADGVPINGFLDRCSITILGQSITVGVRHGTKFLQEMGFEKLLADCIARHTDEECAHHEVEQLAYRGGAGAGQLDEVFDEADKNARDRPIGEAGDQRGQLRHIQLDESGHDGDGKFQVHEHGGHSAKHGGTRKNADFAGRVLHNKMPPVKK